jgi:hypothetical protein
VEEAIREFARAVLQDPVLMGKIQDASDLMRTTFRSGSDVQFLIQPATSGRASELNFIDAGTNRLSPVVIDNPSASSEIRYLMDVLREIAQTKPGERMPWLSVPNTDPFAFPIR